MGLEIQSSGDWELLYHEVRDNHKLKEGDGEGQGGVLRYGECVMKLV